jgi:diacylglycerol kinase (ATP)
VKSFFDSRIHSFGYAFEGVFYMFRTQRNAWIHGLIAFIVFILGLWLDLSMIEWAVITLTAGLVFVTEFVNTSIEAVVDLASPEQHALAKVGKDVAAAAVLTSAFVAVIVGLLILGPPLWLKINSIFNT